MKILITTDKYHPYVSGVVTSVMTLKKELESRGHNVKILTLSENKYTHVEGNIIYVGSLGIGAIYPDVRLKHIILRKTINDIIDWKPDIIHSNCEFSTFFLAKKISRTCKAPMVHTYHTDYEDYVHYVAMSKEFGTHMVKRYVNYISLYMKCIICPTEKTASQIRSYGINIPLEIIPTGLDLERFRTPLEESVKVDIFTRYRLDPKLPVLVFIGRIGKEKNIEEILENLSLNPRKDYQFLIVGEGPNKIDIQKAVMKYNLNDRVIFTGMIPQSDVPSYYKLAKVFISASQSETQGLTYIEALSSAVPLICKKDDCLKNVLIQGKNGYEFDSADEFNKYLDKLLDMDEKEYEEMAAYSQSVALKTFSSETFCNKVLTCYEKALKEPVNNTILKDLYYRFVKKIPFV